MGKILANGVFVAWLKYSGRAMEANRLPYRQQWHKPGYAHRFSRWEGVFMHRSIRRTLILSFLLVALSSLIATPAFAKTTSTTVTQQEIDASKYLQFNNSPSNSGFVDGRYKGVYQFSCYQNFAFTPDEKFVFANSIAKKDGTYNTGLMCFTNNGSTAEFLDGTILEYYGHSEVLAVSQLDPSQTRYQIWVAKCKNPHPKTKEQSYGTSIERLTVSVNAAQRAIVVENKIEINNFVNANVVEKKGKRKSAKFKYGKAERVAAAANQDTNRLAFRLKFKTGKGTNFIIYDLNQVSADMDAMVAQGKTVYNMKRAKNFLLSNTRCNLVPLGGFQSFDVDDANLYIAGASAEPKKFMAEIYKVPYKYTVKEVDKTKKKSIKQRIKFQNQLEFEGVKVKHEGDRIAYYFDMIIAPGAWLRYDQFVYKIYR